MSPKQFIEQYTLSSLYGGCEIPPRDSYLSAEAADALDELSPFSRKKRSLQNIDPFENDNSKLTITETVKISKMSKTKSKAFCNNPFSIAISVITLLMF